MKVHVMNGWRDSPHCWWRYLLLPFQWEHVKHPQRWQGWYMLSLFGFAFFFTYG